MARLHRPADLTGGKLRGEDKECGCDDMREETHTRVHTHTHSLTQIRAHPNDAFLTVAVTEGTENVMHVISVFLKKYQMENESYASNPTVLSITSFCRSAQGTKWGSALKEGVTGGCKKWKHNMSIEKTTVCNKQAQSDLLRLLRGIFKCNNNLIETADNSHGQKCGCTCLNRSQVV